jgi:hypothetical protein
MELFIYISLNNTTFIFTYPFNKEVGKYLNFNFSKYVFINNFKTFTKAYYTIINTQLRKAKI